MSDEEQHEGKRRRRETLFNQQPALTDDEISTNQSGEGAIGGGLGARPRRNSTPYNINALREELEEARRTILFERNRSQELTRRLNEQQGHQAMGPNNDQGIGNREENPQIVEGARQEPIRRETLNAITSSLKLADIYFDGDSKKNNPSWFVQQIEEIAGRREIGENAMKTIFRGALKGSAGVWCRLVSDLNYENLRNRFLEKYWSPETQRNVVAMIHSGSYNGDRDGSYENYFLKWLTHARQLDQPMTDEIIINQMKWHFPERVVDRIENRSPRTLDQMASLLASFNSNHFEPKNQRARGRDSFSNQQQSSNRKNVVRVNNEGQNDKTEKKDDWKSKKNKEESQKPKFKNVKTMQATNKSETEWTDTDDEDLGNSEKPYRTVINDELKIGILKVGNIEKFTPCPTIDIKINEITSTALVDTGSQISAISHKYRKWLEEKGGKLRSLPI